jgi:hypothetical protein
MTNTKDLNANGYAVMGYNINNDMCSFRHGERLIDLPVGAVKTDMQDGAVVALWADVQAAKVNHG